MSDWIRKRVRDVMSQPVKTIDTGTSLVEAIGFLAEEGVCGAPVVDHRGRAIGVVSRFDVVRFLAGLERELSRLGAFYSFLDHDREGWQRVRGSDQEVLERTTVDDVMTPSVVGIRPLARVSTAIDLMRRENVHRILVLQEDEPVGIFTTTDVVRRLAFARSEEGVTARDIMTRPVRTLPAGLSLKDALEHFADEGTSGAPVVDADGRAIGVVSLYDFITFLAGLDRTAGPMGPYYSFAYPGPDDAASWGRLREIGEPDVLAEARVEDVMTAEVVGVPRSASLPSIARTLRERGIHRVLVLEDRVPVGIVTTMDLLEVASWETEPATAS